MRSTVNRKLLCWLQICADDLLLLQMYPGWSARDNYAQTKETANNNSASFTLFLTFIFVQPFPKGFVSKEVYICVCRKRSENGRRHRTREVRLLIVVLLSKGRCRKLYKLQTISKSFSPQSYICDLEDFSHYTLQVFHYYNVLQLVHQFLRCPCLPFQTPSADNVLKAFSILQGTPSRSVELGNNYHTAMKKIIYNQYFFNTKIC